MPLMVWDRTLDIGVEPMNREHREILDVMNGLFDAHAAGKRGVVINELLARLGEVCTRHFADEERYMAEVAFPDLRVHKLIHAKLLQDFTAHAAAIKLAGGVPNQDFFGFLKRWLTAHIKGIDAKYAAHARSAPAA